MPNRKDRANAIRALVMDAVEHAQSGHPGAPMGMADIAEVLWNDYLKHNPNNPHWYNRDRFILSNGHGSMLLYALLHLSGYALDIEDIKQFRQLHSKTPGHPEIGDTPGIETTTGPLGQGMANAIGMAIAEKTLGAQFNRPDFKIIDHKTYVFLGDGCLMEGISHEVCSLAGTLRLGKLIAFYDDNGISIDGNVTPWFTDNTTKRFEAYQWHVISNIDGHDPKSIQQAIETAHHDPRPTLICCKTIIGRGAPTKQGTAACHGTPLGKEEIALTRKALFWHHAPFVIPDTLYQEWDAKKKGQQEENRWQQHFERYQTAYPERAAEFKRRMSGDFPEAFHQHVEQYILDCQKNAEDMATRKASQNALKAYAPYLPELLGGSADLTDSNLTKWNQHTSLNEDPTGNYLFYGVREFGMTAIMNGLALYKGFIPYGGTFLVFTDYARNAVRMSALMKQHVIHVYTHDSIGVGEDGPTHQPIEQLATLRMTPHLHTWRPCDATESAVAWKCALNYKEGPSALLFSRQKLPAMTRTIQMLADIERGGYILRNCNECPELIFIATGSEVSLVLEAAQKLTQQGKHIRVVSMPCTTRFEEQTQHYRNHVLPSSVTRRIAVEAAHPDLWYKYVGTHGRVIGLNRFGESAPATVLFKHLGLTVEHIIITANALLNKQE